VVPASRASDGRAARTGNVQVDCARPYGVGGDDMKNDASTMTMINPIRKFFTATSG
jgi:hypothetical protein